MINKIDSQSLLYFEMDSKNKKTKIYPTKNFKSLAILFYFAPIGIKDKALNNTSQKVY